MLKPGPSDRHGKSGPRTRIAEKVVAGIATLSLVASMCPGTAALAYANGQLAAGSADVELQAESQELALTVQDEPTIAKAITENTHRLSTGAYAVTRDVTIEPDDSGNALQVDPGARVTIIFMGENVKLTVTGRDAVADPEGVGHAAILLPEESGLTVTAEPGNKGTLNATGGKAGDGTDGGNAGLGAIEENPSTYARTGNGGDGGKGGGGAGAAIGTDGGKGGAGGAGGAGVSVGKGNKENVYGNDGKPGSAGAASQDAGNFIISGPYVTVNATGGAGGKGGKGGNWGDYRTGREFSYANATGTSAGGGGGAGGTAADGVGSGGTGGGGGGGGASGNIDGEPALFGGADLDNLWSHGGAGGASMRGGANGSAGQEGANGGDDTDASRKYAKSGGAGGSCAKPWWKLFFFIANNSYEKPSCNVVSGNGESKTPRNLTWPPDFEKYGVYRVNFYWGVKVVYDEKAHGVKPVGSGGASTQSADPAALRAQAEGAGEEWPSSGTAVVDGVEATYSISYYDEATGEELGSAPVRPGRYAAVVLLTDCRDVATGEVFPDDFAVVPIEISKIEVEKPTPKPLTFECADWATGKGAVQDAFGSLASGDYVFDATASKEVGGKTVSSTRSASDAGAYEACFRLADPETHAWAGEPGDAAECWVPWSIALQEFDPNDVTYWGASHDKATKSVTYTGEPVWVRPWFAPAKEADGRFPEWFTHWGSKDRPTTSRASAAVVYLKGAKDREGLVGYHENADGSLEKVTAEQVYAWMFGVELPDGEHAKVKSGQRVWYKVDKDGWKVPLAVGGKKPKGAEGYVVARNLAWADRLGVMDAGKYTAYAYFDSGAGFAPTALAEKTVKVAKAGQAISARSCKATLAAKGGALAKEATVDLAKKAKVSAKTKVAYAKANEAGGKRIAVAKKTGKVTLRKGLKKGTYKVKVRLAAPEGANYEAAKAKVITLTVRVK